MTRLRLARDSTAPVWAGVALAVLGLAVIAYAWGRVAGVLQVPLQLPYVLSGGLGGLALVHIGVVLMRAGVDRRAAAERVERLDELASILRSR